MKHRLFFAILAALAALQCNAASAQTATAAAPPAAASEPAGCLNHPDPKNRCLKVPTEVKTINSLGPIKRSEMSNFLLPAKPVPKEVDTPKAVVPAQD